MNKTKIVGESHNLPWYLNEKVGKVFEDNIFNILLSELDHYIKNRTLWIEQTPKSGDNGKDIIIESNTQFKLFGITFGNKLTKKLNLYIEIKSVNSKTLNDKEYFVNASKNFRSNIDYYILLTNAKIIPNAFNYIETEFEFNNIEFVIMDQSIIAPYLSNYPDLFKNVPVYSGDNKICVEYILASDDEESDIYSIYFLFRNYDTNTKEFKLNLTSTFNWNLIEDVKVFLVEPNRTISKKVKVRKTANGGSDILSFNLNYDNSFINIDLKNVAKDEFITKFVGDDRKHKINTLINNINKKNVFYCIWGDSGIGKSRFIDEFIKMISKQSYFIKSFDLKPQNQETMTEIYNFLEIEIQNSSTFCSNLQSYNNKYRQRIIVIDNFHNAKDDFLEEVKKYYYNQNNLIKLIIVGRTDYTVGSLKYYEFVNWSKNELNNNDKNNNSTEFSKAVVLKKLSNDDCEKLINSIIKDIPLEALDILKKNANGNPLYVTQFIEYLLDKKLIYIANRNSVGIIDTNHFYSKEGIPKTVYEIYECRFKTLNKLFDKNLYDFLTLFYFYHGEINDDFIEDVLKIDNETINFYIDKKLLCYEDKGDGASYKFIHESLITYLENNITDNNKLYVSNLLLRENPKATENLSDYKLGRLYLWGNKKDLATKSFSRIISQLKNIKNISNINIDMLMYDYLDDVYCLLNEDETSKDILVSLLKTKVYITLHHFSPHYAVVLCDKYLEIISHSKLLKNNNELKFSIKSEKAHGLLNSGENLKGERLLIELQSEWIAKKLNKYTLEMFDVFDRLCAINIKLGCFNTAKNFNEMSLKVAKECNDFSLEIIAYRTRSKLYYLNSQKECLASLKKVNNIAKDTNPRISLNNQIYQNIYNLTYDLKSIDNIIDDLNSCIQIANNGDFNRGRIQAYEVLIGALIKKSGCENLELALDYIEKAINMSITFGISSYMWQFYNFKAIILMKINAETDKIKKFFDTAYEILETQNLLNVGESIPCYSNIIVIRNILKFYAESVDEDEFYSIYNKISYLKDENSIFIKPKSNHKAHSEYKTFLYDTIKNGREILPVISKFKALYDDETKLYLAFT